MSPTAGRASTLFDRIQSVVATDDLPALGPIRRPGTKSVRQLEQDLDLILDQAGLERRAGDIIRGAALLWHDHLDEAHAIVQDLHSAEAAFVHGIVHRREPDYSNAKYWFRRVGQHVTFAVIAARVTEYFSDQQPRPDPIWIRDGLWQPIGFVEACEKAAANPDRRSDSSLLQQVQRIEFGTLLEHLCALPSET